MKDALCKAFCSDLSVNEVPAGLAVSTAFDGVGGDPVGFYIVRAGEGKWRIQDDGATVPYLEAAGADLDVGTRLDAFQVLLSEYGAIYNEDSFELTTLPLDEDAVPAAAFRFVALLLRLQDLLFMTRERAESTFVEEAMRDIEKQVAGRAEITTGAEAIIAPELADIQADVVIRAAGKNPVAVFFGTSDAKIAEAMTLHLTANYKVRKPCTVVALLERDSSAISKKLRVRADNNLVVPRYRDNPAEAIGRIEHEVFGTGATVH